MASFQISEFAASTTELVGASPSGEKVIVTSDLPAQDPVVPEPIDEFSSPRLGFLKHLNLDLPDSFFFDPLPEEELRLWEGYDADDVA